MECVRQDNNCWCVDHSTGTEVEGSRILLKQNVPLCGKFETELYRLNSKNVECSKMDEMRVDHCLNGLYSNFLDLPFSNSKINHLLFANYIFLSGKVDLACHIFNEYSRCSSAAFQNSACQHCQHVIFTSIFDYLCQPDHLVAVRQQISCLQRLFIDDEFTKCQLRMLNELKEAESNNDNLRYCAIKLQYQSCLLKRLPVHCEGDMISILGNLPNRISEKLNITCENFPSLEANTNTTVASIPTISSILETTIFNTSAKEVTDQSPTNATLKFNKNYKTTTEQITTTKHLVTSTPVTANSNINQKELLHVQQRNHTKLESVKEESNNTNSSKIILNTTALPPTSKYDITVDPSNNRTFYTAEDINTNETDVQPSFGYDLIKIINETMSESAEYESSTNMLTNQNTSNSTPTSAPTPTTTILHSNITEANNFEQFNETVTEMTTEKTINNERTTTIIIAQSEDDAIVTQTQLWTSNETLPEIIITEQPLTNTTTTTAATTTTTTAAAAAAAAPVAVTNATVTGNEQLLQNSTGEDKISMPIEIISVTSGYVSRAMMNATFDNETTSASVSSKATDRQIEQNNSNSALSHNSKDRVENFTNSPTAPEATSTQPTTDDSSVSGKDTNSTVQQLQITEIDSLENNASITTEMPETFLNQSSKAAEINKTANIQQNVTQQITNGNKEEQPSIVETTTATTAETTITTATRDQNNNTDCITKSKKSCQNYNYRFQYCVRTHILTTNIYQWTIERLLNSSWDWLQYPDTCKSFYNYLSCMHQPALNPLGMCEPFGHIALVNLLSSVCEQDMITNLRQHGPCMVEAVLNSTSTPTCMHVFHDFIQFINVHSEDESEMCAKMRTLHMCIGEMDVHQCGIEAHYAFTKLKLNGLQAESYLCGKYLLGPSLRQQVLWWKQRQSDSIVPAIADCVAERDQALSSSNHHDHYIPQCDRYGNFELVQCDPQTSSCWCVDVETGHEQFTSRVQNVADLKCGACLISKAAALSSRSSGFIPSCQSDGLYSPMQCDYEKNICWCVNVTTGAKIHGTETPKGYKLPTCQSKSEFACTWIAPKKRCAPDGSAPKLMLRWFREGQKCTLRPVSFCPQESHLPPFTFRFQSDCEEMCLGPYINRLPIIF
ncbi:Thyroglobulin [Trichinella pseudospiralis]|uniref:Thyroglobulin n=1 Tax=Trichinella pseudospiralis TaxID=6337 RepID=A0A0V1EAU5_TRIPS|nr:Thyroglobulin [Trichinella pseudospiralis]